MHTEEILIAVVLAFWATMVLWGFGEIALSARRRQKWPGSLYVAGLIGSFALGAGLVLIFRDRLPFDFLGRGLAVCGGIAIWALGRATREVG